MRIRAENRNLRADVMRRMQPAVAQDVRRHRRSRRLAVHAAITMPFLPVHDRGERIRAAHQRLPGERRGRADGVFLPNRGRENNQVGIRRVLRPMLGLEAQAERCSRSISSVRTLSEPLTSWPSSSKRAAMPLIPLPATPIEMNAMALPRQHLLQIEFRGERHDSIGYIFPSFRPRARPRFSARDARNLPPCRWSWLRIVKQLANFLRERLRREVAFL